ncbi:D-arabinono-1,4-lactone oxidase [Microbacterium gorillae]|uniref:D-arabinono-1,4-lactone oxidase n=1 Tax=Microbacterium gorillae TaxID=1231063 RepID=UPI0005906B5F|nr:D-arabinono-1,4-lactone oxidase [Microbacterium gorillae]
MAQNWAGSHTYRAPALTVASSVEDIRRALARPGRVHALGTRHSFTDLPDTDGTLIDVTGLEGPARIDGETMTARVTAGTRYAVLATQLDAAGFALHNMGSLPHINVGGATQTATHGSGDAKGVLSTAVRSLRYLGADGELHELVRGDDDFSALVVGVGAFGIVTDLTLDIEPRYEVRQDVYEGLSWEALFADVSAVTGAADSVSIFSRWEDEAGPLWVKRRAGAEITDHIADAVRSSSRISPIGMGDNITEIGTVGPWHLRIPHFRADAVPSRGDELQTEYFVSRQDAPAALAAVRALGDSFREHLIVTEIRTAGADELWLSPAYRRDSVIIHFTWENRPDEVRAALVGIEAALEPFAARPHWGKLHLFDRARLESVVPRLGDARAVYERLDPEGRFANDHLVRVGLREAR